MTTPSESEKVVHLDDVTPIVWGGKESTRFLLRGENTEGRYSFYEVTVPPGEGSPFHIHKDMDEAFYVIDGEFEIKIGETVHRAPAGALVYGPRGVGHSYYNPSPRPGTMLCTATPGVIEHFLEDLSRLMAQDSAPDWKRMRELAAEHRIVAFRPRGGPHGSPPDDTPGHSDQGKD